MFVAGVGGIGCLLSELLVRAGVGTIYLCDRGRVDASDLNRQLFYTEGDIGAHKVDVAVRRLSNIHSLSKVEGMRCDVGDEGFVLPPDIAVVVDCLDNFESRFALYDTVPSGGCFVHTGVEQFFGQIVTLEKGASPHLNRIFGNWDTRDRVIPVSGPSAGTVASLASVEVVNALFDEPRLLNTLLIVDLNDYTLSKIPL